MLALDKQGLRLGMDRARLMERLALAERHVREAQLKGHSHDAASARDLLTQFEALQALTPCGVTHSMMDGALQRTSPSYRNGCGLRELRGGPSERTSIGSNVQRAGSSSLPRPHLP